MTARPFLFVCIPGGRDRGARRRDRFSHRDANYLFHPISVWEDAADDEPVIAANRAFAGRDPAVQHRRPLT
jgi:hypothetical protein